MLKRLSGTNFRWFEFCNGHEQILRAVKNFNGPFITPRCCGTYLYGLFKRVPSPPPGQKHSNRRILCLYQYQTVDILFVLVSSRKGSRIELKFPLPLVTLIYITKDLLNLLSLEGEERSLTCFRLTLRWLTKRGEWGGECSFESLDLSNFTQNKSTKLTFVQFLKKLNSRVQTMPKKLRRFDGPMPRSSASLFIAVSGWWRSGFTLPQSALVTVTFRAKCKLMRKIDGLFSKEG